jgi:hypothetical protein
LLLTLDPAADHGEQHVEDHGLSSDVRRDDVMPPSLKERACP